MVFDLKNGINTDLVKQMGDTLIQSSDTSQENQFANPGTSKAGQGSFHSIKSNNKSEYNRNLLSDYAKDQGLIGRLGGKSGNLEEVDHQNDLGNPKNSILVNYLGRGTQKWDVDQKGGLAQTQGNGARLTKSIWGNEYVDRDSKFSTTTPKFENTEGPKVQNQGKAPRKSLSSIRGFG